jgi:Cu/Ag efflux protein CusF
MTGLGMAGLLVAAAPAQAQSGTTGGSTYGESSKSKSGTTSSQQDTGTMGTHGSTTGTQSGMATQNEVTGKVDKFDQAKKELTLRLPVSDDTQVTKDGKQATLSDIKEGDQVRASFSGSGDQLKVNRIDVMSAGAGSSDTGTTAEPPSGTRGY